jgi:hypothetical protein
MTDVAVILPGARYTAQAPLLYWSSVILEERGWHVHRVHWTIDEEAGAHPLRFVDDALERAFDSAPRASRRLIVAKSFGSFGLPRAIELGIPGVWLTPVLSDDAVAAALRAAGPEHLAVGGTADGLWQPERAAGTRAALVSIADADHALAVRGGWSASIAAQSTAFRAIAGHLDRDQSSR